MEEWGARQGLVIPYFRAMAATLASPKGWVPPPSSTDCQGWGMRAHSLKALQGSHLGVGTQRRLGDKVWEVTQGGCVCSAWDCESHGTGR